MKKLLFLTVCMMALFISSFAQLQDEKNVTITMDLQPILQLKLEGPEQIDFTFDEIAEYYAGIVKYGANILKVSSSVSFDLWASGLSQQATRIWDNPVNYGGGGAGGLATIPITALELRQFPANPSVVAACATIVAAEGEYTAAFAPRLVANTIASNNLIHAPVSTAPYTAPIATGVAGGEGKYIAGGDGTGAGCQVVGGSYLEQTFGTSDYYYVMDYRIVPGLPAVFPAHDPVTAVNAAEATVVASAAAAGALLTSYATPGFYTMYVKYILTEDQ